MPKPMDEVLENLDRYLMKESPIHDAARAIAARLKDLGIPFAVAGALAVNAHGHARVSADVDILLTPEGLRRFKERWLGLGWVEVFPGSKGIRDAARGVKIDILLTGDFPGDGKEKPVSFPDPAAACENTGEEYPVLSLPVLLELKIASGMTAPHRFQDLADAIQLIRANGLPPEYAARLNPYVREKFAELWSAAQIREDY